MTLRDQILSSHETLSDFAWAADARFHEAQELLATTRFAGAVYLSGIACEMWLKLAAIRCHDRRVLPTNLVTGYLPPIRKWMTVNFPSIPSESYHSLEFWAEYIIGFRARNGMALPAKVAGELRHHVIGRLFEDWRIDVRYRSLSISERHAWRVFQDLWWVRANWNGLWR